MRQRILPVFEPTRKVVRHELHLGAERKREIWYLVPRREIHQNRNVEIRHQVEEKILKLIFLGSIERELSEHNSAHVAQQPSGAEVQQSLIGDRHRIVDLLEKKNRVAGVDLVRSADRLLNERQVSA